MPLIMDRPAVASPASEAAIAASLSSIVGTIRYAMIGLRRSILLPARAVDRSKFLAAREPARFARSARAPNADMRPGMMPNSEAGLPSKMREKPLSDER